MHTYQEISMSLPQEQQINSTQPPKPQAKGIGHIGDYCLLNPLQSGTQATVFTGEDKTGKKYAIKIFNRT